MIQPLVTSTFIKFQNLTFYRDAYKLIARHLTVVHQRPCISKTKNVLGNKSGKPSVLLTPNIHHAKYYYLAQDSQKTFSRQITRNIHLSLCYKTNSDIDDKQERDRRRMKRLVILLSVCFILWMGGIGLHILLLPSIISGYDELAFLPTVLPWKDFVKKLLPTGEVEKIVMSADTVNVYAFTKAGLREFKLDIDLTDSFVRENFEKMLREEERKLNIHPMHGIPIHR